MFVVIIYKGIEYWRKLILYNTCNEGRAEKQVNKITLSPWLFHLQKSCYKIVYLYIAGCKRIGLDYIDL